MRFFQHRDRHRHGGKIINDFQMAETEVLFHLCNRKRPRMVGHRHPVARNRAGDRDTARVHFHLVLIEVNPHDSFQAGIVQAGIGFGLRDVTTVDITQSKTRVGAADITY